MIAVFQYDVNMFWESVTMYIIAFVPIDVVSVMIQSSLPLSSSCTTRLLYYCELQGMVRVS